MTPIASPPLIPQHSRTLGACWVIYGIFRVAIAVWMAAFTATATVMFGALLARVPEPFSLMADFHLLYLAVVIWGGVSGVVGLLAGVALLAGRRAGTALVRLAAYLCVGDVPLGTTPGDLYTDGVAAYDDTRRCAAHAKSSLVPLPNNPRSALAYPQTFGSLHPSRDTCAAPARAIVPIPPAQDREAPTR